MHYLSIAAIHRGEHEFLREWLEYHLLVGVEHFYLYNDDRGEARKVSSAILKPYVERGLVDDLPCDHDYDFQHLAYADAATVARGQTRWVQYLDLDEFLFPLNAVSVRPVYEKVEKFRANGFCIPLVSFGCGGNMTTPPLITQGSWLRANNEQPCNWSCKYAIDLTVQPGFSFDGRFVDELGKDRKPMRKEKRPWFDLRVNHYPIKSEAWWQTKVSRGFRLTSTIKPITAEVWDHKRRMSDHNDIYDDSMKRFGLELQRRLQA